MIGEVLYKVVNADRTSAMAKDFDSKFVLSYRKGDVVTAPSDTLGVFCFRKHSLAEKFLWVNVPQGKIILVKALSPVRVPKYRSHTKKLGLFYKIKNVFKKVPKDYQIRWEVATGTVVCKKIEVLT